jgi:hypothetical protein
MIDKSRRDQGAKRANRMLFVLLATVAVAMYVSIFVKLSKFGF